MPDTQPETPQIEKPIFDKNWSFSVVKGVAVSAFASMFGQAWAVVEGCIFNVKISKKAFLILTGAGAVLGGLFGGLAHEQVTPKNILQNSAPDKSWANRMEPALVDKPISISK